MFPDDRLLPTTFPDDKLFIKRKIMRKLMFDKKNT